MVFSGKLFYGIVLVILDHYNAKKYQLEASFTAKSPVDWSSSIHSFVSLACII